MQGQRAPIIRLLANVPLVGQIKFADIVDGTYGPQLKIKGSWDAYNGGQPGDGIVYVHDQLAQQLLQQNLIRQGRDQNSYQATGHNRVKVLKSGEGRSVRTTIESLNGTPPAQAAGGQARTGGGAPAVPSSQGSESAGVTFQRVVKTYGVCVAESRKVWGDKAPPEVVQAGAACLFIELNRRNVLASVDQPKPPADPVATDAQLSELYDMGGRLGWTQEATQADIMRCCQVGTIVGLTVKQAEWAKQRLMVLLAEAGQPPNNQTFA